MPGKPEHLDRPRRSPPSRSSASSSGSTVGIARPLVARVVTSTHTSAPSAAQRASVPPAEISGRRDGRRPRARCAARTARRRSPVELERLSHRRLERRVVHLRRARRGPSPRRHRPGTGTSGASDSTTSAIVAATASGPGPVSSPPAQPLRRVLPGPLELVVGRGVDARSAATLSEKVVSKKPGSTSATLIPKWLDLELQRLGQALERELRARVHPVERRGDPAGHGRDVHDRAARPARASAGSTAWIMRSAPKKFVSNIRLPSSIGQPLDRADHAEAGVVDQRVDAPGGGNRGARPTRRSRRRARARCATSRSSSTSGRRAVAITSWPRLVSSTAAPDPNPLEHPVISTRMAPPPSRLVGLAPEAYLRSLGSLARRRTASGGPRRLRARARRMRRSSGRRRRRRRPCG